MEENERINWPCRECGRCEPGKFALKKGGLCMACAIRKVAGMTAASKSPIEAKRTE